MIEGQWSAAWIATAGAWALQLSNILTVIGTGAFRGDPIQVKIVIVVSQTLLVGVVTGIAFLGMRSYIAANTGAVPSLLPAKGVKRWALLRGACQFSSALSFVWALKGFVDAKLNAGILAVIVAVLFMFLPSTYRALYELAKRNWKKSVAGVLPASLAIVVVVVVVALEPEIFNRWLAGALLTPVLGSFVPFIAHKMALIERAAIDDGQPRPISWQEDLAIAFKSVSLSMAASSALGLLALGGLVLKSGWLVGLLPSAGMYRFIGCLIAAAVLFQLYQLAHQWANTKGRIELNSAVSASAVPAGIPFAVWWLHEPFTWIKFVQILVIGQGIMSYLMWDRFVGKRLLPVPTDD